MGKHRLTLIVFASFIVGNLLAAETLRFSYDLEGDTSHAEAFKAVLASYSNAAEKHTSLFEMTWFRYGSCRVASWTTLSKSGAVRKESHVWNWAVHGSDGRKALSKDELQEVEELLATLPDSATKIPRATMLLVSYVRNGERLVRAYDRSAPPEAILKLDKILKARLESGPEARGDVAPELEILPKRLDIPLHTSFSQATVADVSKRLERELGVPIYVDADLVEQAPNITMEFNGTPLRNALTQFSAKMNAGVYFTRDLCWISRDRPPEVISEEEIPVLSDADQSEVANAIRDLQIDRFNTREAAATALLAKGPGVLKLIDAARDHADFDLRTRFDHIEETLRAKLRDGSPTVRLKILLRLPYPLVRGEYKLKRAAETITEHMDGVAKLEFEGDIGEKTIVLPELAGTTGYAALEFIARTAGCRLIIKGNTIRFTGH
jgi:hypothetical protein